MTPSTTTHPGATSLRYSVTDETGDLTARSLGTIDRKQIAWIPRRHITEENLEKALRYVLNIYDKFVHLKHWGTGERATAGGGKWDLLQQNLLLEYHFGTGDRLLPRDEHLHCDI